MTSDESGKIQPAEFDAWFPEGVPMLAVKILFPEKSAPLTTDDIRAILAALSKREARSLK